MTPEQLRRLMELLRERVTLEDAESRRITFEPPGEQRLVDAGLPREGVRRLLEAPWYEEMISDIRETPEFCSPEDPPETVLGYARDVVTEYLRKRYEL
jgi:hypothetical protein